MKSAAPRVFAFVLLFAFALMLVAFRSLVIAAKAIVLNLLSAAAYGAMVLVFQHGWGKGLLGFESTAGVVAFVPRIARSGSGAHAPLWTTASFRPRRNREAAGRVRRRRFPRGPCCAVSSP